MYSSVTEGRWFSRSTLIYYKIRLLGYNLLHNHITFNTNIKIEVLTTNVFFLLTLGSSKVAPTKLITYELLSFDKMATSLQNMSTSDLAPNEFPLYL